MNIESYDEKIALPIGIVLEVNDGSYWNGTTWIKTGGATWARLRSVETDGDLQQMIAERRNNISPCPSEQMTFSEAYSGWNLQVLAKAAMRQSQDLIRSKDRQRVLEQRNEKARLALAGIVEEA